MNLSYISEKKDFQRLSEKVNRVIKKKQELPYQVFNQSFINYRFNEFDWAIGDEIWNEIKKQAALSQDSEILMAVLDPDPIRYRKNFNHYNWAKIPIQCTTDDYLSLLFYEPSESPADAIVFAANIIIWMPLSMKWAVWGSRYCNLCVLGTNLSKTALSAWNNLDSEFLDAISINFKKEKYFNEFKDKLLKNYVQ